MKDLPLKQIIFIQTYPQKKPPSKLVTHSCAKTVGNLRDNWADLSLIKLWVTSYLRDLWVTGGLAHKIHKETGGSLCNLASGLYSL